MVKFPSNFTIKADQLALPPVVKSDAFELYQLMSIPEISRDMAWSPHSDLHESQTFLRNAIDDFKKGKSVHWCIRFVCKIIGLFSLIDIRGLHRAIVYNRAEIAYWLDPNYQRRGFMSDAASAVIAFAF